MSDSYKMIYSRDIKKADEYINSGKYQEANETYWDILEKIRGLKKEITDLLKPFIAQIKERKNIAKENIVKLQVKEADQYYNEFRFKEAVALYEKAKEGLEDIYSPLIKGDKGVVKEDLHSSINKKIEIARATEKEYLKNKVKAYCDKIEVYNIRDDSENANKIFNDLSEFIKDNPGCEKYPEVAASYKEIAEVLNVTITKEAGDMVFIPAGEFLMGSDIGEADEKPVHKVYLDAYYIDKYEVTNAQYAKFLNAYGKDTDDNGEKMIYEHDWGIKKVVAGFTPAPGYENHPVIYVTWYGANQYVKWAGKRLPTEAEWEKACRAGSNTKYCFGDDASGLGGYAWYDSNSGGKTHPVGKKNPNKWGIYDMHGNVWEWCSDRYDEDYYKNSPARNPTGSASAVGGFSLRGGSWNINDFNTRSAVRNWLEPVSRNNNNGFRCVSSGAPK